MPESEGGEEPTSTNPGTRGVTQGCQVGGSEQMAHMVSEAVARGFASVVEPSQKLATLAVHCTTPPYRQCLL